LTEDEEDRLKTLINKINARSLTLLIFVIRWAVWSTTTAQPGEESMMTAR